MASTDISTVDSSVDPEASELAPRQLAALATLKDLGAGPRAHPDDPYDTNPKIRANQLIYEGRLGGPNRGQGRKKKPRAGEVVAIAVRDKLAGKIVNAIERGLDSDNEKTALLAGDMAIKIEREETALQLKEQSADLDLMPKEELLETLFALVNDAQTGSALEEYIDLPESSIHEVGTQKVLAAIPVPSKAEEDDNSSGSPENGANARSVRENGRGRSKRVRKNNSNSLGAIVRKRAANG